jgi:asparagine synthase (glutamine-hydrolysing)
MRDTLEHRGPDDAGLWTSRSGAVLIGSRRLAIQDLSPRGHQPMQDSTGRFTIVFNGEIYNWLELRRELESFHNFRSGSDTEVLLASYVRWGADMLPRLNGMFAFAIWDEREQKLFAARDRFGERPFYYHYRPGLFLFASEMKALLASRLVPYEPNLQAIYRFLAYRETDVGEETLFKGIQSLPPSHSLSYSFAQETCKTQQYWDLRPGPEIRYADECAYAEHLLVLLRDSVKLRLRADVPVGSCLSGGIDSSAVLSLAAEQRQGDRPFTFSARFQDRSVDEGQYIRAVTEKLSTPNFTVYPDPYHMIEELNTFTWHQEHPFASASLYSQWCVMRLAKEHGVTVLLDGQGGDELLAGYLQSAGAYCNDLFSNFRWASLARTLKTQAQQKGFRGVANIVVSQLPEFARQMATSFVEPLPLNRDFAATAKTPPTRVFSSFRNSLNNELYQQLRYSMLPKLLRYADRSSMAFSREVRLPLLDHRLVEYLFALPADQTIRGTQTKYVLRRAMRGTVPDKILDRTDKKGFETPQSAWLRGPLRPWAENLLHSQSFAQRGWIDAPLARDIWRRFLAQPHRFNSQLIRWLSLETWAQQFLKPPENLARPSNREGLEKVQLPSLPSNPADLVEARKSQLLG